MKIEAGRYYKTRDGRTVGPMRRGPISDAARYWQADGDLNDFQSAWFEDGLFWPEGHPNKCDETSRFDLISPAYPEQGTLKEIGAKPGDAVQPLTDTFIEYGVFTVRYIADGDYMPGAHGMFNERYGTGLFGCNDGKWCLATAASDTTPSPVRTVTTTRQEIVPGVYGAVKVHDPGSVFVRINIDAAMSAADLTAAINTLTEIRDAITA